MTTTQGNMLARHSILHELGRGGIGAVYAARDRTTGAVVALKRLDPALLKSDASLAGRFLKLARSTRTLRHRNIVEVHDAGEAAGTAYVTMEMLEGENLRKLLDAGPIPVARAIQIAHEIASALAYAHLEGVMHWGLKPSNIIVLRSGAVKVTDFGIGHAALPSGAPAGALGYLSPEQLRGDAVDHRSDIFSFGVLLYEMLARRPPYEGGSAQELVENMLHAEPPPPSEVNPHVPRALDALVKSMLAAQPVARMPGMPIVLRELQRLEEGLGLGSGASASEGARRDEPAASVPPPPAASRPAREASEPPRQAEPPRPASGPPRQAPRFPPHAELREERGFTAGPDLPPADAFQQRNRIADQEAFDYRRAMMQREWPERSSRSWPAIFAAIALVLAVLGIGMSGLMDDWPWLSERGLAATRLQETPVAAPAPSPPPAPLPLAEITREPVAPPAAPEPLPARPLALEAKPLAPEPAKPLAPEPAKPLTPQPAPLAQTERLVPRPPEEPASSGAGPAQPLPRTKEAPAKTAKAAKAQPPGATARVILAISPRGELYIDGKHHGATPPITTLDLEPGMHRIEVRNGSRKPFLTYLMVDPGDVRRIRHDFNAKPLRPPN